jgi:hypothetical protein
MTMCVRRIVVLTLTVGALAVALGGPVRSDKPAEPAGVKLAGPFTSANLSVFLIRGADRIQGKTFLTLEEALAQKIVVVHETQHVSELTIDNTSKSADVFIQAGDIVKGGQQDRVLAFDLVVPPETSNMPLRAFCVEAGRWTARGGEAPTVFGISSDLIASNGQKVAARAQASQQEVWRNVATAQTALAANAMTEVRDRRSTTSLQLTLENPKLKELIADAVKQLSGAADKTPDAIGCAIAINGKVIGADTYASAGLFKKLWPKLLKAAAVEAVAERKGDAQFSMPSEDAVRKFLADGDKGKAKETAVSKRINQVEKVGADTLLFECRDSANSGALLRKSYLTKTAPLPPSPQNGVNPLLHNVRPPNDR